MSWRVWCALWLGLVLAGCGNESPVEDPELHDGSGTKPAPTFEQPFAESTAADQPFAAGPTPVISNDDTGIHSADIRDSYMPQAEGDYEQSYKSNSLQRAGVDGSRPRITAASTAYVVNLRNAYLDALDAGDIEFAEAIESELQSLNEAGALDGDEGFIAEDQLAQVDEDLQPENQENSTAETDPYENFDRSQCAPPTPPGVFKCPCPGDVDWRPDWRNFYNPDFVKSQNCKF